MLIEVSRRSRSRLFFPSMRCRRPKKRPALSAHLQTPATMQQIEIINDQGAAHSVRVPVSALRLFMVIWIEMGKAISRVPMHAELTTQALAEALNLSHPFLVQLLERGEIPFHKIGTQRRVRHHNVIASKERIDSERSKALDALADQGQSLKMGYEGLRDGRGFDSGFGIEPVL